MYANMLRLLKSMIIGVFVYLATISSGSAISADLAKKCRAMAFKEYPAQRVGTKTGNSPDFNKYFHNCIANNGAAPAQADGTPASAPAAAPAVK